MAEPDAAARLRRAAILRRCQQAREDTARRALGRALRVRTAAEAALAEASAALAQMQAARAAEMARQYGSLAGRRIDAEALRMLPTLHERLRRDAEPLSAAVTAAEFRLACARAGEAAAAGALANAVTATRQIDRLAQDAAHHQQRTLESAAETEQDDAVADAWRPGCAA